MLFAPLPVWHSLMWSVKIAVDFKLVEWIVDDFLRSSFGSVEPMSKRHVYAAAVYVLFDIRVKDNMATCDGLLDLSVTVYAGIFLLHLFKPLSLHYSLRTVK